MATNDDVGRWVRAAMPHGYGCNLTYTQIRDLLDAGLLVAPPAPPPEVTFRGVAYTYDTDNGVFVSGAAMRDATADKGFRPGATLEVTVRQVES